MATAASREARRRKILERGSERLGLITGQIQASSPPSISHLQLSSQPSDSLHDNQSTPSLSDPITDAPRAEDKASHSVLRERVNNAGGSSIEPCLHELETSVSEVSSQMQSNVASAMHSSLGRSSAAAPSVVRDISVKSTVFTPDQIKSAVAATEKTRLICSATVAFIVVLSCLGFPLMGNYTMKHMITFRPLYLVLLTDVTLVLARLLFGNLKGSERAREVRNFNPSTDGSDWTAQVGKFLEAAFLMQKVLDAVFMDCSVYALIVICGLAFA